MTPGSGRLGRRMVFLARITYIYLTSQSVNAQCSCKLIWGVVRGADW
jgi:hypothetical protein